MQFASVSVRLFTLCVVILAVSVPGLAQIDVENTGAKAFGPVQLKEGQRFQVCANARFNQFASTITASFRAVRNSNIEVRSRSVSLAPGEGACTSVSFAEVFAEIGDEPIFALLTTIGDGPTERDAVASACIINAVFLCTSAVAIDPGEIAPELTEVTTYGPISLKPDTELLVCASNAFNETATTTSVAIFLAGDSSEPLARRGGSLQPGRGSCVSIPYSRVRNRPVFAEIRVSTVTGLPRRATLGGAGITNGIFQPIPGQLRLVEEEQ